MHPTVLIGLDGATFTVLNPLMAEGHLPHLSGLIANGARAELLSTAHPLTPPAWTTLMTGMNPGTHGVYDFLQARRHSTGAFFTLTNFRDIRSETLWSLVSRQGGRVTCLNFPLMAPPPPVHGAVVPGLLSWRHLRMNVHPPELYHELLGLDGFNPREVNWDFENEKKALQNIPPEELRQWVAFHIVRERHWFNMTRHLMTTAPADLTAVLFDGADKLQHGCWHLLDPRCLPEVPTEVDHGIRELCLDYFRTLDGFIGRIAALAGDRARIFIASDHGSGPTDKVFHVNSWLHQRGYLAWPKDGSDRVDRSRKGIRAGHYVALDMPQTTAYAQSAATNGVHIRLSEQPGDNGVPVERYPEFRDQLVRELLAVRDPDDGEPLIKEVLPREQAYPGPHMDQAPDLTLVLRDHGPVSVLPSEEIIQPRPRTTGTHYPQGVLIASGPGIRRGVALGRQSIVSVAATLLYSLGLPVPEDFEGGVVRELFEPALLGERPVVVGPPTVPPEGASGPERQAVIDAKEEGAILDRLRALGYVE